MAHFPHHGKIHIKSYHCKYLCAPDKPMGSVVADREKAKEWETWIVENQGSGKIALKSTWNRYLSVEKDHKVVADRTEAKEWETFQPVFVAGDLWCLKTYWGTYLTAEKNHHVAGDRKEAKDWEHWHIERA